METITLVPKKAKGDYAGRTLNMPVLGLVTFDKEGTLTVDNNDKLEEFLKDTKDSFGFEDKNKPKKSNKDVEPVTDQFDDLTTKELLELGKEAGFEADKMASWTDARLKKELLKKVK